MGKLNLLHHKSWHVYSKENRERVRKDEEAAAKEEEEKKERVIKAEQEARLEKLREASSRRKEAPKNDDLQINEHVNLFKDLEKHHDSFTIIDQKTIDQKKWEDRHTMFLGETKAGKKDSPWYNTAGGSLEMDAASRDKGDSQKRKKRERQEEKRKKREDPMEALKQFMESRKSSAEPPSNSISKKRAANSSSSKSIEQLRQERLERELAERNRTHEIMNPLPVADHSSRKQFYNSQFNPNLIRKDRR